MTARRVLALAALAFAVSVVTARAEPADRAIVEERAAAHGVSPAWAASIVDCETGGTFSNHLVGKLGEVGLAQLKPGGELDRFFARGYTDPTDPWQSASFLAERLSEGGWRAWRACA